MTNDYLRGLESGLAIAQAKQTSFAFSVAAGIQELIDAENKRLGADRARKREN